MLVITRGYLQVGAFQNLQAMVSGQREPWIEHRRGRMWGSRRSVSGRNLQKKGPMCLMVFAQGIALFHPV